MLNGGNIGPDTEVWILIRLCDAEVGARRIDSSDGIPEIVVLDQRRSDQFLQLFVLENLEPFEVSNGLQDRELSVGAPRNTPGAVTGRSLVVRTDHAAAQQTAARNAAKIRLI